MAKTAVQGKPIHKWPTGRKLLYILGLILALIAIGIFVRRAIHQHAVNAERARFVQASVDLNSIAKQVIATVGTPQLYQNANNCSYAHELFTRGPLSCNAIVYVSYKVDGPSQANQIYNTVAPILKQTPQWIYEEDTEKPYDSTLEGSSPNGEFITFRNTHDFERKGQSYQERTTNLGCFTDYIYLGHDSISSFPLIRNSESLLLVLGCGGAAMYPYFTLKS